MADKDILADDGISTTESDENQEIVSEAQVAEDASEEIVEEVVEIDTSVAALFEGEELSEEFKEKVTVVFEAAVNEQAAKKFASLEEDLTTRLEAELQESVDSRVEEIVENLDKYLDYVVNEWMEENQLAIEAGIKVEMAESFISGLKDLFEQHNVEVDEETFDAVASLEEEVESLKSTSNNLVEANIDLQKKIDEAAAEKVFNTLTESMNDVQAERFRILSENLISSDLEVYAKNLRVIKESFFASTESEEITETADVMKDNLGDEEEVVLDEGVVAPASEYSSINALVEALNTRKANA